MPAATRKFELHQTPCPETEASTPPDFVTFSYTKTLRPLEETFSKNFAVEVRRARGDT